MFDFIVSILNSTKYVGIFLLMFIENIFPPIPSELIMPLAGYIAAKGEMNFIGVVIAGTAGSLLGVTPWYYAGRIYKYHRLKRLTKKYGKWLTINCNELDKAMNWFNRYGTFAVCIGRMIPAIRTLISVPAGLANMNLLTFLLYSTLGSVLWTLLLASAGFILENQYHRIENYLNPVSNIIIILLVLFYLYRIFTNKGTIEEKETSLKSNNLLINKD